MGILDSIGQGYLVYVGVDDSYPGWSDLCRELDAEIMDAAAAVIAERRRDDPELRISLDERCVMWEYADYPVGILPVGAVFRLNGWYGKVRAPEPAEREWDAQTTRHVHAYWGRDVGAVAGQYAGSDLELDRVVSARVPVPLDRGALLRIIDAAAG